MSIRFLPLALALTLVSGAAGLAHQLLWTRRLVDVLGASADTFSKVVGAFFVGLALGAWLASGRGAQGANFWRRVALAELAVAALALPVLFSTHFADWLYGHETLSRGLKFFWPLLLVTPPAIAMGLVVPWMVRALAQANAFQSRHAVWLYAMNTFGGVLGLGAVLLFILPRLGLTGAGLSAIGLNLLVASGAFLLSRNLPMERRASLGRTEEDAAEQSDARRSGPEWFIRLVAFASGFLVLALEVVLQHQLAQVSINSLFSSAIVLALVLTSLVLAATAVPAWVRWCGGENKALKYALLLSALLCACEPFLFTAMRGGVNILLYELAPLPYAWEVLKLGLLTICPMLLASGLVFPLLLRQAVENVTLEVPATISRSAPVLGRSKHSLSKRFWDCGNALSFGRCCGRGRPHSGIFAGASRAKETNVATLFAWNGLGGWLGAELGQSFIAPAFGLWGGVVLIAAGYAGLWLIYDLRLTIDVPEPRPLVHRKSNIVNAVVAVALLVVCAWFARTLPQATVAPNERLAALAVGHEGVVATLDCGPGDWRMLFNNSYTLGGSKAQFNQERQALLPLLLHGDPKSVATLGVATGSTAAGAALHPGVERIDAIELSPLVLRYAEEFFTPYNRNVFHDSRVRFLPEDARWVIARKRAAYDVVAGDLFLPWRTGEGRLFTQEHFQNVRRSLKPDGLYCQWLPLFQLTRPQFEAIVRTFRSVFPDAVLVRGDFYTELPIVGLIGGRRLEQWNWSAVEAGCARLRADGQVTDPLVRHAEGVAMLVIGPVPEPPPGPINTLGHAWLEWDAGQNILGLQTPWFIGIPGAEYVRDLHRASQPLFPEPLRAAHDAGQFFLTLEIAAKLNLPVLQDLKSQMTRRLPAALRDDPSADWRQWPMRIKPLEQAALPGANSAVPAR